MHDPIGWALALAAGFSLGSFFFAGLWWTTRKAPAFRRPALWFLGSFFLRTIIVLSGFWILGAGQWQRLILCVAGFILARFVVKRATRETDGDQTRPVGEERHET